MFGGESLQISKKRKKAKKNSHASRCLDASPYKIKFWSSFFKSLWFPKAKPLVAMSRLQLAWEIGYALRDPKLNCVQLPRLREKWRKPLRWKRQVALNLSASFYLCVARHEIEQSSISLVSVRAFGREKVPRKFYVLYNPSKTFRWTVLRR